MYTTKDDAVQRLRFATNALMLVARALDIEAYPEIAHPIGDIREVATWLDRLDLDDQADQLD